MQRTELPAPTAGWTLLTAFAHYGTFTSERLANTRRELHNLGADTHPDVAIGLAALAQLPTPEVHMASTARSLVLVPARDLRADDTFHLEGSPTHLQVQAVATSFGGNIQVTATTRTLGCDTTIRRYLQPDLLVVLVASVHRPIPQPAVRPTAQSTAAAHATVQAEALDLARELVCTDAACLAATSHVSLCRCAGCRGADHGAQQDRAGLIPAVQPALRVRANRAMRALIAAMPNDEEF